MKIDKNKIRGMETGCLLNLVWKMWRQRMNELVLTAKDKGIDHINKMLDNLPECEVLLAIILAKAREATE